MKKVSFKYNVGHPVAWTQWDGRICIVRSSPGVWNGEDYIWYVSEVQHMDNAFGVHEGWMTPLELYEPNGDPKQ